MKFTIEINDPDIPQFNNLDIYRHNYSKGPITMTIEDNDNDRVFKIIVKEINDEVNDTIYYKGSVDKFPNIVSYEDDPLIALNLVLDGVVTMIKLCNEDGVKI